MTLFVWHRVDKMTDNWHHEAGVVVIADSLERARVLAIGKCPTWREAQNSASYTHPIQTQKPDATRDGISGTDEACWVFPDAGCC